LKFIFIIYLFEDTNIATNLIKLKKKLSKTNIIAILQKDRGSSDEHEPTCTYIVVH